MANVFWECPACGATSEDDTEAVPCPQCVECEGQFSWDEVDVLEVEEEEPTCEYCGADIDPDNGPLCQRCYEEDQWLQYGDYVYDERRIRELS
jgi:hypothetical protein